MNVRKIKRKCMMRGCKNTTSYSLSLTRELGNSVILCAECAKKAHETICDYEKPQKEIENAEEVKEVVEKQTDSADDSESINKNEEPEKYICPNCGREFTTLRGLKQHIKSCDVAGKEE